MNLRLSPARVWAPFLLLLLVPALLASASPAHAATGTATPAAPRAIVAGDVIVQFRRGTTSRERAELAARHRLALVRTLPFRSALYEARGDTTRATRLLRLEEQVRGVDREGRYHWSWIPNDPQFTEDRSLRRRQWYLPSISVPQAWNLDAGGGFVGAGALVAVIDSGVDATHPELVGKVVRGRNYVNEDARSDIDVAGHGTSVAGIVAATTDNGRGISGIAPRAQVLALKVGNQDGLGLTTSKLVRSIKDATDAGADVINLSLGGPPAGALRDALRYAAAHDVVVVCASGNDGTGRVDFPAAYPECLAVGATGPRDRRADFSTFGSALDLVAPGTDITSLATFSRDEVEAGIAGTSFSSPIVAGVAALLKARGLSRAEVVTALQTTADDLGPAGWDREYGHGKVNAARALATTVGRGPRSPEAPARPACSASDADHPIWLAGAPGATKVPVACDDANADPLSVTVAGQPGLAAVLDGAFPFSGNVLVTPAAGFAGGSFALSASDASQASDLVAVEVGLPPRSLSRRAGKSLLTRRAKAVLGRRIRVLESQCGQVSPTRVGCYFSVRMGRSQIIMDAIGISETAGGRQVYRTYFSGLQASPRCLRQVLPTECARHVSFS